MKSENTDKRILFSDESIKKLSEIFEIQLTQLLLYNQDIESVSIFLLIVPIKHNIIDYLCTELKRET